MGYVINNAPLLIGESLQICHVYRIVAIPILAIVLTGYAKLVIQVVQRAMDPLYLVVPHAIVLFFYKTVIVFQAARLDIIQMALESVTNVILPA